MRPRPSGRGVVTKYARFIHLAVTEPEGAAPSKAVDAVWHLHLLSTRSYWTDLCGATLGRPLHHDPGRGRPGEAEHFQRRCAETLAAYERAFGEPAPFRFWPSVTHSAVLSSRRTTPAAAAFAALKRMAWRPRNQETTARSPSSASLSQSRSSFASPALRHHP